MTRILTFPITLSLRLAAVQLRLARAAAEIALDWTRDLTGAAPPDAADVVDVAPPRPAPPRAASPPPVDPAAAPREARRRAAVQRTGATRRPPPATTASDIPLVPEEPPRPRPRRDARKATASRPARRRTTGPTKGEAAAIREAQREAETTAPEASVGPATGAGPEIRVAPPWEDYDAMALHEVLGRLEDADPATVAAVRLYESAHESRQAILLATETP